jgi:hypothetical protein
VRLLNYTADDICAAVIARVSVSHGRIASFLRATSFSVFAWSYTNSVHLLSLQTGTRLGCCTWTFGTLLDHSKSQSQRPQLIGHCIKLSWELIEATEVATVV